MQEALIRGLITKDVFSKSNKVMFGRESLYSELMRKEGHIEDIADYFHVSTVSFNGGSI